MNYIRIDLLDTIAHWNQNEEKLWQDSLEQYERYLKSIRHRLPRTFYEFISHTSLHDYSLVSFNLIKRKKRVVLETEWAGFGKVYKIVFNGVTRIETNLWIPAYKDPDISEYLYGEITALNQQYLHFDCILTDDGYLKITFQNIRFVK